MRNLIPVFLFLLMVFSCGPSRTVSFTVTRPAEITLPSDVNVLLLVDRTKPGNEMMNILEGIFTGELPSDDKVAAQEAMINMKSNLDRSPRFTVKIHPERLSGNSLDASFPPALGRNEIDKLCLKYGADALVCLEVFDSDFIVTHGARVKKRMEGQGDSKREVEYTEYYSKGAGNLKIGFRTYHKNGIDIIDQQMINENNTWEGTGNSPGDALNLLISKSNANKYLAKIVGEDYAYKIAPLPVRVSRPFYGKSKRVPELAAGSRLADVSQWTEAIDEWKRGLNGADQKDAGRLSYNIAVAYEVLGEYGTALTWSREAYTKYGNKEAREYSRTLQRRIDEESVLKEQMGR